MAQVRLISDEEVAVPELGGFGGGRVVQPGELVAVSDDRYLGFVEPEPGQASTVWEGVVPPDDPTLAEWPAPTEPTPADPAPPTPGSGPTPPTPDGSPRPLYVHAAVDQEVDADAWPLADVRAEDGTPLYHFTGDTGADATGASDAWHVYTGPTVPASEGSDH